jgi:two-component system response regulator RegX3
MTKRILIIEDDKAIARLLRDNLEYEGFLVETCENGRHALASVKRFTPDLLLLDIMLPHGIDGFDICRSLNESPNRIPVIILSARGQKEDRIRGLTLGADDYVTKPFSVRELVSRVRALLRRTRVRPDGMRADVLSGGPVEMDVVRHEVLVGGDAESFPPKEFELLETFLRRKGRLLTRDFLIEEVWGTDYFGDTKTLDVHVKRLRKKIEADPHEPVHLVTVRGLGYKFVD